jgi:uncharacterized protein YjdB
MRQRKRGLAFLLAMALVFGGFLPGSLKVSAAGTDFFEDRTAQSSGTRETEETEGNRETKTDEEAESKTETESTKETESTEESESIEETESVGETETTEETESTKETENIEETETAGESETAKETESTEETGVGEDEAALYGTPQPSVSYRVHMQTYNWQDWASDGAVCGKENSRKRLEALEIKVSGIDGLGVEYQVYSADGKWHSGKDGSEAGTTGQGLRVERLKASLTGTAAGQYDIYYRVCVQEYGWLDWASNGREAGVDSSWNRTVEAIQVKIQTKGSQAPGLTSMPYLKTDPDEGYPNTHVNTGSRAKDMIAVAKTQVGYYKPSGSATKYGTWYNVYNNSSAGDYFPSAPWCAMFMSWCAKQADIPRGIFYINASTVNMARWYQNEKNPGYWHDRGTYTPQPGDLIFFKFSTNNNYVNHVGVVTGVSAGKVFTIEGNTSDSVRERNYALDSASIVGYATPDYNETGLTVPPPESKQLSYRADVEGKGWAPWVGDGETAGTTGSYKMLRALMVDLSGKGISGGVTYRTHMQTQGWQNWVSDGAISGIPDGTKRMEAVQIKLTGEAEKKYDIYYRVHSQSFGWLDWAKNGESAGSEGYAKRMEAIEIRLVQKGAAAPGKTGRAFVKKGDTVTYSTHCQTYGWLPYTENGVMNGTTGEYKRLEGIRIGLEQVSGEISYRTHVQT